MNAAADRVLPPNQEAEGGTPKAAVASFADEQYCTTDLKRILRRVLKSCGLLDAAGGTARGCQPLDAKQVATMDGKDFNALFIPMKERGGIIQFEQGKTDLSESAKTLLDKVFSEQRGASYFFIVARASPEGTVNVNREISKQRAEVLMNYLRERFADPDLEREVGLLWLGEEYAQLEDTFCSWPRSGDANVCRAEDINRSAFIAWIDCHL
jgi:outer membrane protein OmpA-like peptidoglycan-associated protein